MCEPKVRQAYIVGTHPYVFRSGEVAEILGVNWVEPQLGEPRASYRVRFADGAEDFWPIGDSAHYRIVSPGRVRLSYLEADRATPRYAEDR